jgi:SAM-dependent methyltransferase/uncharacterized protein YbaR (Trm112 family)
MSLDSWLHDCLVCPRDHQRLIERAGAVICADGHRYPVVDGIPVMLRDDVPQTFGVARASLDRALHGKADARAPDLYLESVGISEEEKQGVLALAAQQPVIDPVVSYLVAATNGLMYRHLRGRLPSYPIPEIEMPDGRGLTLLDVGCSWGRWTLAAARRGYRAVGIDPSLGAVMAARRVARDLKIPASFIVGDARYLPLAAASVDAVFSYSVLQHFSRSDAAQGAGEIGRVLNHNGFAKVQMPTRFGVRCLYQQARRGFADGADFDVRYWSLGELRRLFTERVGRTRITVEGYFGIGLQQTDARLLTVTRRGVLRASHWMTVASRRLPWLTGMADSVYVEAVKA